MPSKPPVPALKVPRAGTKTSQTPDLQSSISFPPVSKSHILNCSFHSWYGIYNEITPTTQLIPLTDPFLTYLRADGIIIPSDHPPTLAMSDDDHDSGVFSASTLDSSAPSDDEDIAANWRDLHEKIRLAISRLGGSVYPKLNWSAPKDAVWISATRSMACHSPAELYLLLKSSDFISHDLHHAFEGTFDDTLPSPTSSISRPSPSRVRFADIPADSDVEDHEPTNSCSAPSFCQSQQTALPTDVNGVPYHLVLRQSIPELNPALEFRCFVRERKLIGISQRDKSFSPFLFKLRSRLDHEIRIFFHTHIRHSFPDPNFAFDVYVPDPYNRVWLIDINPWAPKTDSLLFDWAELLTMPSAPDVNDSDMDDSDLEEWDSGLRSQCDANSEDEDENENDQFGSSKLPTAVNSYDPHFRLVRKGDPSSWHVAAPQYGAHKLPQDVVDAANCRPGDMGLREFAAQWFRAIDKQGKSSRHDRNDALSSDDDYQSESASDYEFDSCSGSESDSDTGGSFSGDDSDDDFRSSDDELELDG